MTEQTGIQDLVYSLDASPNFVQDGICFAARTSGLYRSSDGGATWHAAYDSLELEAPLATLAVIVSPSFESDQRVFAGVHGGILRSADGGTNWHVAALRSPPPIVTTLAISPNFAHDGTLFAGTMEDGVFRSADRGSRWSAWNFGLLDLSVLSMAISPGFVDDETLFVGTETGVFRSTNGGRAWREVNFPTELAPVLSLALSPGYVHDTTLFAGTESGALLRSEDKGGTWTCLREDAATGAVNGIMLSTDFPAKPDILVVLSTALTVSRDGGQSWSDREASPAAAERMMRGLASAIAPRGLDENAPLLVGLVEGGILLL
jgi:photosystem II stability/assembly factor-like uncharacterized protein